MCLHERGQGGFVSARAILGGTGPGSWWVSGENTSLSLSYWLHTLSSLSPSHLFIHQTWASPPRSKSSVGSAVGEKVDNNGTGASSSQTVQVPIFCWGAQPPPPPAALGDVLDSRFISLFHPSTRCSHSASYIALGPRSGHCSCPEL